MIYPIYSPRRQRGAVLVVGMIVLMLITLMVAGAFKFSTYNLQSVGNAQSRNEAIASANKAIEQVLSVWNFASTPAADHIEIDIDNNGTNDYTVDVAIPVCIKATSTRGAADAGSDCHNNLDGSTSCAGLDGPTAEFNAVWEVDATATINNGSGTKVRVRQGISRPLTQAQCNALCLPPGATECK
jgi:Tfp pilus assembly protein PilV